MLSYLVSAFAEPLPIFTTPLSVNILLKTEGAKGAIKTPINPPSSFFVSYFTVLVTSSRYRFDFSRTLYF